MDDYWFVCLGCGAAVQTSDAAAKHADNEEQVGAHETFHLVDDSVVNVVSGSEAWYDGDVDDLWASVEGRR